MELVSFVSTLEDVLRRQCEICGDVMMLCSKRTSLAQVANTIPYRASLMLQFLCCHCISFYVTTCLISEDTKNNSALL
jgi:hypothetical protein